MYHKLITIFGSKSLGNPSFLSTRYVSRPLYSSKPHTNSCFFWVHHPKIWNNSRFWLLTAGNKNHALTWICLRTSQKNNKIPNKDSLSSGFPIRKIKIIINNQLPSWTIKMFMIYHHWYSWYIHIYIYPNKSHEVRWSSKLSKGWGHNWLRPARVVTASLLKGANKPSSGNVGIKWGINCWWDSQGFWWMIWVGWDDMSSHFKNNYGSLLAWSAKVSVLKNSRLIETKKPQLGKHLFFLHGIKKAYLLPSSNFWCKTERDWTKHPPCRPHWRLR